MLPRLRSFYGKFVVLGLVVICLLLFIKVLQVEHTVDSLAAATINVEPMLPHAQIQQPSATLRHYREHDELLNEIPDEDYEQSILADVEKQVPSFGRNGEMAHLTGAEQLQGQEVYKKISLDEVLSERLPYNRTLRDQRHPDCKLLNYDVSTLPSTSVIIIFFNEPYSVLLRTIYSTLTTCNSRLLKEIILVDDGSTNKELRGKLDYYIATRLPTGKVKVLRLKNR